MDIYDSIQKANKEKEDIVKSFFGNESTPELVKRVEGDIEKGKRANIGEIRIYGGIPYKKISSTGNAHKDWVRVKDSEGKAIESEKKNFDRPYLRDINLDGDIKYLQSHIDSIKSDLKLEEKHQILKDSDLEEMRYAIGYLENKIKSKEKEIKDPIDDVVSTDMEKKVLKNLIDQLYAEPGFSDVGVKDLASETKLSVNEVKGVIGSLTKKGIVSVGDKDFGGLIYLNHKYYYLHPEWGKQSNVKEDKSSEEKKEVKEYGEIAIFDLPNYDDETIDDGSMVIEKRKNGTYYGRNQKWDFEAKDLSELNKKLQKWGYTKLVSGSL